MRRRDPFAMVLGVLTARLRAGAWAMGEALSIADLSQELKFSTTPVREALAFLAGQGAIADTRGSGYLFGRLDDLGLLDAYELHEMYVLQALARPEPEGGAAPAPTASIERGSNPAGALDPVEATRLLFEGVVARGRNRLIAREHQALGVLLGRARRSEASLFPDLADELVQLQDILAGVDLEKKIAAVQRYGRRRVDNVSTIQSRSTREYKLRYTSNIA